MVLLEDGVSGAEGWVRMYHWVDMYVSIESERKRSARRRMERIGRVCFVRVERF